MPLLNGGFSHKPERVLTQDEMLDDTPLVYFNEVDRGGHSRCGNSRNSSRKRAAFRSLR
jgi:hypothetical protein